MIAKNMLLEVKTLTPQDPVEKVIEMFLDEMLHVAPVVNSENEVIGIISQSDIYQFLSKEGHYESCPIEWLMTKNPITADENTELNDLIIQLRSNHIFSIPIVKNMKLVGIVTMESILDYIIEEKLI